jgi:hypothetical protein
MHYHHRSHKRPDEELIRLTAYYHWEALGKPEGKDLDIWLEAKWLEEWRHFSHKPVYAVERDSR